MFVKKNLALVAALFLAFCLNAAAGSRGRIKDMRGNVVELPREILYKSVSLRNPNRELSTNIHLTIPINLITAHRKTFRKA